MYHYTYIIKFKNKMKYIGVRSSSVSPDQDTSYLGSSKIIPPELYATCKKRILNTFNTRIEAIKHEMYLHDKYNVSISSTFYNQTKQTSTLFDMSGCTKETHQHVQQMAEKLKGRTKDNYSYIKQASLKRASYRGNNRTAKQLSADAKLKGKSTPNKAKGLSGSDSPKFKPWYYITPDYEYIEVNTSIRKYCMEVRPEWSTSNLAYCLGQKEHEPLVKGSMKGFTFGYLHTKPEYITQDNITMALQMTQHLILRNLNKVNQNNRPNLIHNITGEK